MDDLDFLIKKSLSNQVKPDYFLLMQTKQTALQREEENSRILFILTCILSILSTALSVVAAHLFLSPLLCVAVDFYCLMSLGSVFAVSAMEVINKRSKVNILASGYTTKGD